MNPMKICNRTQPAIVRVFKGELMRFCVLFAVAAAVSFAQRPEGSFERAFTVNGAVELDLNTDAGGISVVPGPPGTVRVRGILKVSRSRFRQGDAERRIRDLEANPPIKQNGNSIRVAVRDPQMLRDISMRLEVQAPQDSRLRARTDSGGIDVRGIKGPIDCETDSGGIHANEIDGEVRARADSGGIHIRRVNGPVYAQADSGGIDALEVAGAVEAEVDSGGIRITQTKADSIKAHADSGGADITLASTGGYELEAHSDSGGITAPELTVSGQISRRHVAGKVRGGGPRVDVRTDSGRISIR
jgi:hypothetical protein